MKSFEDLFSNLAQEYARYRPSYPSHLASYLASLAPSRRLVWDCGTGSGQAALLLAGEFEHVLASDASFDQVRQAKHQPRVLYCAALAQHAPLPGGSTALVTVAQAVHWFDLDAFYAEVRRVLEPRGVLAVWTYHLAEVEPAIDRLMARYYSEILGPYWSPRMHYLDQHYQTLPFPFDEITPPDFSIDASWDLGQLLGFLASWSATRPYQAEKGIHPLELIYAELLQAWGDPHLKRVVHWPLCFRIGR